MSYQGQIVMVETEEIVVDVAGQNVHFILASDAWITLDGVEASVTDLQPRLCSHDLGRTK